MAAYVATLRQKAGVKINREALEKREEALAAAAPRLTVLRGDAAGCDAVPTTCARERGGVMRVEYESRPTSSPEFYSPRNPPTTVLKPQST